MKKSTLLITTGIVLILVSIIITPVTGTADTIYKYYAYEIDEEDIDSEVMVVEKYQNLSDGEQEAFITMYNEGEFQTTERQPPINVDVVEYNEKYHLIDISEIREPAIIGSEVQYGLGIFGLAIATLGSYKRIYGNGI